MEAVSSLAESQARYAAQASVIAIQNTVESEKQAADLAAQQTRQVQPAEPSDGASSNPPHLGQAVDTYA